MLFFSKDKATSFSVTIKNTDDFKSFKYNTKLLGINRILKNATFAVPLKYFSNFWR